MIKKTTELTKTTQNSKLKIISINILLIFISYTINIFSY